MEEEMTPERTPHATLVSNVSSERGEEWEAHYNCELTTFDTVHQTVTALALKRFTKAQALKVSV